MNVDPIRPHSKRSYLRREAGIRVAPREIRALTDSRDTEACRKLSNQYSDQTKDRFFFEAGPYYFIIPSVRDDSRPASPPPTFVLDQSLDVVKVYL